MVLNHLTAPVITPTEVPPQQPVPGTGNKPKERTAASDPNIPDHRLNVNRPCIYERRLPGNAYITAHVQRLQHGYYSTDAVSDRDIDHVDFLAVSFVFHSPDTLSHRFKAATIRASLHHPTHSYTTNRQSSSSSRSRQLRTNHPRFLMHAPHLLYGSVSPETLQWSYSLAGTLGIAQLPLIASLSPAAGLNGRFSRYEMMRIQGSVRTLDGAAASQIVWTLEENTLQRSGLPREFTFAMLIAKPAPESRVQLVLEIEPILQCWFGSYPGWWLTLLRRYRAVRRKRGVDFRTSVGQRFGASVRTSSSSSSRRGFNFANLVAGFDEYVSLSGKRTTIAAGGDTQDQTDGQMPFPLPNPNPYPNPNPNPNPFQPQMPWPEDRLWPREPQNSMPRGRVRFDFQAADENADVTTTAQNRSYNSYGTGKENINSSSSNINSSSSNINSSSSNSRSRSSAQRSKPRREYYQPR